MTGTAVSRKTDGPEPPRGRGRAHPPSFRSLAGRVFPSVGRARRTRATSRIAIQDASDASDARVPIIHLTTALKAP